MQKGSIFDRDEKILDEAKQILENQNIKKQELKENYQNILKKYEKLLKQFAKLVKLSDKQQLKLNSLNEILEKRNNLIKKTFKRYLSDEIVEEILNKPEGASIGGEKKVITILLSDLRGFSVMSETLVAEDIIFILNLFMEKMTDIIFRYQGTIDEFTGDGILAIFGAPIYFENHADMAVSCAIDMQNAIHDINKIISKKKLPSLKMGIGINTGEVVVGNIGSIKRTKYGVVGRNVNLTARIESFTSGGEIYISENTYNSLKSKVETLKSFEITPKGFKNKIKVYSVYKLKGKLNKELKYFEKFDIKELKKEFEIKFNILSESMVLENEFPAKITGISNNYLLISSERKIRIFTNIKITKIYLDIDKTLNNDFNFYIKIISFEGNNQYKASISSIDKYILKLLLKKVK